MQPHALTAREYDIGRAAVFYADPYWDGSTNLFSATGPLVHLGTTEGEIKIEPNAEYSELTLPENTGPAALKRYLTGTRPTFTLGLFPSKEQMEVVSPTGVASLGMERQRLAKTYTLWIVPEALFLKPDANGFNQVVSVVLNNGVWEKDGDPLTAEEERLLHISSLIHKADFAPLTPLYKHEDGGKSLTQVEVVVQHDFTKPEGCQQILVLGEYFGDYPVDSFVAGIDFEPV